MTEPGAHSPAAVAAQRRRMVAAVFDRAAQTYDQVGIPWFTPIAQRLVEELRPAPGERILDAGCGRGATLFLLAEAAGPTGQVTGIDLAAGMVEAVRADAAARGLDQVNVELMDAAEPDLSQSSFDVIASSLVLFFLPDPAAALSRWHELLKGGGRIGISTFGQHDARWVGVDEVFTPYLPQQMLDARTSGRSGPFSSDAGVEDLLTGAGFTGVRTVRQLVSIVFEDAGQWNGWTWSHGQRAMWEAVPEDHRAQVLADAADRLEAARDDTGKITFTQEVRYTLGAKG